MNPVLKSALLIAGLAVASDERQCLGTPVRVWIHQGWRKTYFKYIQENPDTYLQWTEELKEAIPDFDFGLSTFMDRYTDCTVPFVTFRNVLSWEEKKDQVRDGLTSRSQTPVSYDDEPEDSLTDIPYLFDHYIKPNTGSELKLFIIVTDDYGKYHGMESNHPLSSRLEGSLVWSDIWTEQLCDPIYQYLDPSTFIPELKKQNLHMGVICRMGEVCDWWRDFFNQYGLEATIRSTGWRADELSDSIVGIVNDMNCALETTTTAEPETTTTTTTTPTTTTTTPTTTTTTPTTTTTTPTTTTTTPTTTTTTPTTTTTTPTTTTTTTTTPGTTRPKTTATTITATTSAPAKNNTAVVVGSASAGGLALLLGGLGAYRQLGGGPAALEVEEEEVGGGYDEDMQREAVVGVDEHQFT